MLLVTGLGASLELARPFEQELTARGVQTVAFDAPGIGESTAYTLPRRMPGIARTIEAMLDALGYDRVDVLGVSLGGVVAQQLAHQAPRRVRRLVLAATGPGLGGVPGSPRVLLALATPRRYYQPDYYRRIAGRVYGGQARRDPDPLLHGSPARFVQRPSVRGYLGQLYAIAGWTSLLGCTGSGNRRWCWPATTTRSSRCSTDASSPAASPTPACTLCMAVGTCSSSSGRRRWQRWSLGSWRSDGERGPSASRYRSLWPHEAVGLTQLRRLRALPSAAGPIGWPNRSPELGAVTVAQREIGSLPTSA